MTYEEKMSNSKVVRRVGPQSYRKAGIQSAKGRLISILVFIFTALYTLYTKFILKDFSFDILILCTIINLITLIIIKFLNKSLCVKNNSSIMRFYRFLILINKSCKVVIFGYSLYSTYKNLSAIQLTEFNCSPIDLLLQIIAKEQPYSVILQLPFTIVVKLVTTALSFILTIPAVLSLLLYLMKILIGAYILYYFLLFSLLPVVNLILLLFVLRKKSDTIFKHYVIENKQVYIEYRKLHYSTGYVIKRKLLLLIPCLLYLIAYYYIFYCSVIKQIPFNEIFTNLFK